MGSGAFFHFLQVDFFSTRVMGGVAVVGVERVCDFCMRVLFLVPVQLWGVFVRVVWTDR